MKEFIAQMCGTMGMIPQENQTDMFGTRMSGNGEITQGSFWFYVHANYFVISHCDFVFCRNCKIQMPSSATYIALRLDIASHLPPGKIISFMEEAGASVSTEMKAGSRVAYTEVLYAPDFYKKHLNRCFPGLRDNPTQILKDMGGEHNWPSDMMNILMSIQECSLPGAAAELFLVAKAYELMAMLVNMGDARSPRNAADYSRILAIINHLDASLNRTVKQCELIQLSNMSATKLKSLFKQFTGRTITEYILEKKADKAAHLLSDTNLSVEAIARSLGFDTPTGFSTSFKKQMGIAPTEYRKRMAFHCMKDPSQIKDLSFS